MSNILKILKATGNNQAYEAGDYFYFEGLTNCYIMLNVTDKVKDDIKQEFNFKYIFLCLVCDTGYINGLRKQNLEYYQYVFQKSWYDNKTLEIFICDILNNFHRIDYKECEHIFMDYFLEELFDE